MSQDNEDQTVAISGGGGGGTAARAPQQQRILSAPKARLLCTDPSQIQGTPANFEITLDRDDEYVVGRDPNISVPIDSRKLSRRHARVFVGSGNWGVEDLQSTNGVFVNGQRVQTAWLRHGDEVRFGPISFRFQLERVDLSSNAAVPAARLHQSAASSDEDASERTVAFGGQAATAALMKAQVEQTKEEVKAEADQQIVGERQEKRIQQRLRRKTPWGTYAFVVVLLLAIGAGAAFYLNMTPQIDVGGHQHALTRLKEEARELANAARIQADYTDALASIDRHQAELDADIDRLGPQPAALDTMAYLALMGYERRLAAHLVAARAAMPADPARASAELEAARALSADVEADTKALAGRLPEGVRPAERTWLDMAPRLIEFGKLVTDFRGFTIRHGTVEAPVGAPPTPEQVATVFALKEDFSVRRRNLDSALSGTFLVLGALAGEVGDNDVVAVSEWQSGR